METKALYNSLRMNWLQDSSMKVEEWQVANYRAMDLEELFERLEDLDIHLDRPTFMAYAQEADTPEELAGILLGEEEDALVQDQVYLVVFELWRRFVIDKPCLTLFCDELDWQINRYDSEDLESAEPIHDILDRLETILDENVDDGGDAHEVFKLVSDGCANDIEDFLYDFVAEQIDNENFQYAAELVDGFYEYVSEPLRFDFLRVRLLAVTEPGAANEYFRQMAIAIAQADDLDLKMEMLSQLAQGGQRDTFAVLMKQTLPLIKKEEDLQDALSICSEFYRSLDCEKEVATMQHILEQREGLDCAEEVDPNDPDLVAFSQIVEKI